MNDAQGAPETPVCRKCKSELTSENWAPSYARYNNHICIGCTDLYNKTKRPRITKECVQCHSSFTTLHKEAKFCSHRCYQLNTTGKRRPRTSEALTRFYASHPEAADALRKRMEETQFKEGHEPYITKPWLGKEHGLETRLKMSASHINFYFEHPEAKTRPTIPRGPKHGRWKGGISGPMKALRATEEYNIWRKAVYVRDNWTCQDCGSRKDLIAHHLKSFNDYPEFRFDVDNGITLCRPCHKRRHLDVGLSTRFKPLQ